jgi:Beta-ketoacyl synthase, N-terminal domain
MATMMVNKLNRKLNMGLPLNTCHTYVDLVSLTKAIHKNLGLEGSSSAALPSTKSAAHSGSKEDIVIVGQAVRLPGDINNAESLWKALIDQRDDIMTPIPEARWDHKSFYRHPDSKDPPAPPRTNRASLRLNLFFATTPFFSPPPRFWPHSPFCHL